MKQKRWYHIDPQTGKKVIRSFDVGVNPGDPWLPGMGPHSPEAYAKTVEYNRKHFKGKPKPPEQREKMRQAKLGKRFTPDCAFVFPGFSNLSTMFFTKLLT